MDKPPLLDRRAFLRAAFTAAGGLALASCTDLSPASNRSGACPATERGAPTPASEFDPASRPTLRLAVAGPPGFGFPSPYSYFAGPGYSRMILLYDTLLWADVTGELLPWLAADWSRSDDERTYTFQLRDGITWHDGEPLTADDVVFSFAYYQRHTLPAFLILPPEGVEDVSARDDRTVVIRLDQPRVTFPRDVAGGFPIVPKHIWSGIDDPASQSDPSVLVGSGPYQLDSFSRQDGSYLFTANDDFFLGAPFVERIEMRPVSDELTALANGDLDAGQPGATGAIGASLNPFCDDDGDFAMIEGYYAFTGALYWNLDRGRALADPAFRQACAHAIDRTEIVSRLLNGRGAPGNPGFLPPDHPDYVEVDNQYPYDLDEANRLLDEAGYSRGDDEGVRTNDDGDTLRFSLMASPDAAALVDLVTAGLDAIGVAVDIEAVEPFQVFPRATEGDYDMAVLIYADVGADADYMRKLYSSREEPTFHSAKGYANDEFDELANRQLQTADEEQRSELIAEMQRLVAADLPFLPLYYPTPLHIYRPEVYDQWTYNRQGGGPYNKQGLITGTRAGGTEIRPTT
jgi:peptide/nickel transport system substrate-binding protein